MSQHLCMWDPDPSHSLVGPLADIVYSRHADFTTAACASAPMYVSSVTVQRKCALSLTSCHLLPQHMVSDTVAWLTALCITGLLVPPATMWKHRALVDVCITYVRCEQAFQT